MAREELALQTQLLLQEASHLSQGASVADAEASALVEGDAPAVSELEAARQALLDKLKAKKEQRRAQMQQINQRRYGFGGAGADDKASSTSAGAVSSPAAGPRLTPVKAKAAFKPPVAAAVGATAHKKQDLLMKLRKQAIQQGAQNIAKMFGYKSYEEQIRKLNQLEKKKIMESERRERGTEEEEQQRAKQAAGDDAEDEEHDEDANDMDMEPMEEEDDDAKVMPDADGGQIGASSSPHPDPAADSSATAAVVDADEPMTAVLKPATTSQGESVRVKRRNLIAEDEDDGNEADSEQDGEDNDNDEQMEAEVAVDAASRSVIDAAASSGAAEAPSPMPKKDRAAAYRELLRAEAQATRRRKRLVKGGAGGNFVESEAEEDEEEDALKIGGLGDFGFGVPQAKTQESKEAEEERNALKLREDDLEGIVDDLSDDEQAQQQDLDEIFRKEVEDQDREQVKEVMRNVKEGFGRNRRAFSAGFQSGGARGRFNLDELVAADGSKFEAARLGLLESDEELSESETRKKTKRSRRKEGEDGEDGDDDDDEEEDNEEEDEEAEMERMLRERYKNQPQIYVTSSESEEEEEEDAQGKGDGEADADELNSDEEREKQQMKLFSERARINRRMARMKDLQRQISLEQGVEEDGKKASAVALPNLLLEEDEDSQELLKILNRTDVNTSASAATSAASGSAKAIHTEGKRGAASARPRPMLGRFNSFGSASSFNRVAGNCTMFNTGSGSGQASKGFVFTSLGSERAEQGDAPATDDSEMPPQSARPELGKSKSWGQPARRAGKRSADGGVAAGASNGKSKKPKRASDFFSVLTSYKVVPSSSSNHSAPL